MCTRGGHLIGKFRIARGPRGGKAAQIKLCVTYPQGTFRRLGFFFLHNFFVQLCKNRHMNIPLDLGSYLPAVLIVVGQSQELAKGVEFMQTRILEAFQGGGA